MHLAQFGEICLLTELCSYIPKFVIHVFIEKRMKPSSLRGGLFKLEPERDAGFISDGVDVELCHLDCVELYSEDPQQMPTSFNYSKVPQQMPMWK